VQAQPNQRATLDTIAGKLMREVLKNQDDRIYLHHDKPYYMAGSDIWFRVYILKDLSGQVSGNRNNIYVTLTNDKDSVIVQTVLNSGERDWSGALNIPAKSKEGFYTLRAFTRAMNDENADKDFSTQIYVVNGKSGIARPDLPSMAKSATGPNTIMHFYPEGGSLVNGVDNLVAIEATDGDGNPVMVEGRIIDDNQKMIATFKSDQKGHGVVLFTPFKNRSYKAIVKRPNGADLSFNLPPINYSACQLNLVSQDEKKIRLRVVLGDSLYPKKPVSYVLGVSQDKLCFAGIGNGMFETDVSLAPFPPGPAVFYVFDEKQQLQSTRRVFIDKKNIKVLIQADKETYAARQKAVINVSVSDLEGKPLQSLFSVSVTDDRLVGWPALSSGTKMGDARDTVALLKEPATEIHKNAENYRILGDSGIVISGTIKDRNGNTRPGLVITVFAEGTSLVLTDTTDTNGKFSFPAFDFTDQSPFFTQVTDLKGVKQDVIVTTDPLPFLHGGKNNYSAVDWNTSLSSMEKFKQAEADSISRGVMRNQLEVIANNEGSTGKKSKSTKVERGASSHMITGEQLDKVGMGNTVNAVMMLPGVIMVAGKLTIRGGNQAVAGNSDIEPLVIVDGVPAVSSNVAPYLNSLPPQNIESIEVITGGEAARYGTRAANGVILIKMANNLRPLALPAEKGIQYIFPVGYQKNALFYMPPYNAYGVREASFTDNRATIYWNGEIMSDQQGKASFQFFTADMPATYTIRVKGVTSKGDFIDETYKINRK
jgi:TonB-dependent SusC/RagA subfamily outer membrane receptor